MLFITSLFSRWRRAAGRAGLVLGCLAGLLSGCVDKYTPDVIATPQKYLVVDGFINLNGVTTIRLTRTRSLASGAVVPVETKATVAILDDAGNRYALTEPVAGTYVSAALALSPSRRYQLRLHTAAGRDYASDLVVGKLTPAIDQLSWTPESTGVQLYLDAHDAANATRYYRWNYVETWEFHSQYFSNIEYVKGVMQTRNDNIFRCWRTENSSSIVVSNTTKLSQDVVSKFPLALLSYSSNKINIGYSILVQQHAQTPEEYAYWDNLKKNTESLGTLFDPLPSQISGNVHNTADASELVLGYVGASSIAERRLFIDNAQLPASTRFATGNESCPPADTVFLKDVPYRFNNPIFLPIYPVESNFTAKIIGYAGGPAICIDCRLRGTNIKPSFWP